jgi:molybdopterin-guanine dinucleotide biosynthesis protein A
MPFVAPQLLAFLFSLYHDESMLVPRVNGHPQVTLAIYPRSILPLVDDLIRQGRRDLRSLLEAAPVRYVEEAQLRAVDPSLRSFRGVNTPEELQQL